MEVQITDFENAAFAVFIVLLSRAIMTMNVNFYIPISKVRHIRRRLAISSAL
jgi:glutamate--cysteine ligase catalytic subunit